ncbi:MAG TPA: M56 family metallopeptidase [Caulobacteraceae bacterium]|jgi:beta-lactamase regulating signal transducer with metallopeptidase domain|nr:M56 family metallopeptidase [Caulobacteraceae bacterium]
MTTADLLVDALVRSQIAASLAIMLVLALRPAAQRLIGAELTYRLWVVAPVAAVVALFPSLSEFLSQGDAAPPALHPHATLLLEAWALGVTTVGGLMALAEALFRRSARQGRAGPAVMGVSWPRIVTPSDYAERFTAAERALIGRHERTHIARRDPRANLFIAAMGALAWFNPLVHIAAACARLDQELACDAAVIEAWPGCRRDYGATLVKAHMSRLASPLACAWPAAGRHPLEVRLGMLARPPLSLSHYVKGAAGIGLVAVILAIGVWTLAP